MQSFLTVTICPDSRIVRAVRTSVPTTTLEHLEETWGGLHRTASSLEASDYVLLFDVRRARGRNDEAFERVVAKYRRDTLRRFVKVAVLVRSVFGRLQIERHGREDGLGIVKVFVDEAEALEWLAS